MKMVSIKDMAKSADVSVMTVSRVINDSDYVSDKTRGKIRELRYLDLLKQKYVKGVIISSCLPDYKKHRKIILKPELIIRGSAATIKHPRKTVNYAAEAN